MMFDVGGRMDGLTQKPPNFNLIGRFVAEMMVHQEDWWLVKWGVLILCFWGYDLVDQRVMNFIGAYPIRV